VEQSRIQSGAAMGKNRLEAFSDGVLAILITIMVPDRRIERAITE
jgi:uncharacterized membrane protein